MRRSHLEALRPVCPVCRVNAGAEFPLRLAQVASEDNGHVIEGVLHCSNPACLREHPIIDGIPIIVADIRQYVTDQLAAITQRDDLGMLVESMVGDCCGPLGAFNSTRQFLSSYTWDHYADLDPAEPVGEPRPGSMLKAQQEGLARALPLPSGAWLDAGCSVGRGTFALAERTPGLVLGVDLNFAMLRVAARALRAGVVQYPRRQQGLVYERRTFPVTFSGRDRVDFWACDVTALPFPAETFAAAVSMNVLDCVAAPQELLASLARTLRAGGKLVLTCPYDWSPSATPIDAWLGGHSQRSATGGSGEHMLRSLLTPGAHPSSVASLRIVAEQEKIPWHVRLHDRSTMTYQLHLVVAAKRET